MRDNIENDQLTNLVKIYSFDLRKLAWGYVKDPYYAEDIVQEVFLKCFNDLEQLRNKCSIRAWLYTVTKNQCKDFLRTKYFQNDFLIMNSLVQIN